MLWYMRPALCFLRKPDIKLVPGHLDSLVDTTFPSTFLYPSGMIRDINQFL